MTANLNPFSVLIADDNEELRAVLVGCLSSLGHAVTGVSSGFTARLLLESRCFDLVITDLLMPDGDGLQVIGDVKKRYPTTRILAMTGGGDMLEAKYCARVARDMGAHGALQKPFTTAQLLAMIQRIMPAFIAAAAGITAA